MLTCETCTLVKESLNMSSEEERRTGDWPIQLLGAQADFEEVDRELGMAQLISFLASLFRNTCKVIFEALVQ